MMIETWVDSEVVVEVEAVEVHEEVVEVVLHLEVVNLVAGAEAEEASVGVVEAGVVKVVQVVMNMEPNTLTI
jgi:hypothetical protein